MASFLALYYVVMLQREPWRVTTGEVLLDIWIAAFAYDELVDFTDAGLLLYATDFWTPWDLGIICVGATYMVTRTCKAPHMKHSSPQTPGAVGGTRREKRVRKTAESRGSSSWLTGLVSSRLQG